MKMKNKRLLGLLAVVGFAIVVLGLSGVLSSDKKIIGILFGIGVSMFGLSISRIFVLLDFEKYPNKAKQSRIDERDERNIQIRNRARAKAGSIQQWLVLGIAYMLIAIDAPLWSTALTTGVFMSFNILSSYYNGVFQREM